MKTNLEIIKDIELEMLNSAGSFYSIKKTLLKDLLSIIKTKESQMEPTAQKPFDIDRCLNEDGGRCIHKVTGFEMTLLSPKLTENNHYVVDDGFKTLSFAFPDNLQNIPRRKERWFNFRFDGYGRIICTVIAGFTTKQEALNDRQPDMKYIGDPICISSKEL